MAKPILKKIEPFDANKDYDIEITWTGNRAYANRIIIYDNESNNVVFDDTVSSFSLKHTIPAYTLTNGKAWVIQAQTIDQENVTSSLSDKVLFYTFETPDFYFNNIPSDNKITNASFSASVYYYSSDWENISNYIFYLYDSTKKELMHSGTLNDEDNISYSYRGLSNNTIYYIRCIAVTVNGMELDTGYAELDVKYENLNTYARIYTTSEPEQGCVQVASNLIIIQYNGTEDFTYEDGMINLENKTVYYDEGFEIKDDFTVIFRGKNMWKNGELLNMNNDSYNLILSSRIYPEGQLRFRLLVPNAIGNYLLYSDPLVFEDDDMITVGIRKVGNVYQIKTFIELGYSTEGNMWYGTLRPTKDVGNYDSWVDVSGDTYMVDKDTCTTYLEENEPALAILNDLWLGGE